jgi:plasmid maintenance system antidote protein VapI
MALFHEGLTQKDIATRMKKDASTVGEVILNNKNMPVDATLSLAKKQSGRPSLST